MPKHAAERRVSQAPNPGAAVAHRRWLTGLYLLESLTSGGYTLLSIGIFFFTTHRFAWQPRQNFLLAAAQGLAYVGGALLAQPLASRFGQRRALAALLVLMGLVSAVAAAFAAPLIVTLCLVAYTFVAAANWPMQESLVSQGADAHALSRRIGIYNLTWSGTAAIALAVNGIIIKHWTAGVFLIPAIFHIAGGLLLAMHRDRLTPAASPAAHAAPEPDLLAKRTLALWLSRLVLPATYVVIVSLMAIMPSLPVMQQLDVTSKTLISSTWLAARWLAFLVLSATVWWHTRPRLLLVAATAMLLAFFGVTIRPSDVAGTTVAWRADLASMLLFQLALGACLGIVYAASLYFGMVLSDGATEHGGYHEALIGVGCVVGPGSAALVQWLWPGKIGYSIAAVGGVLAISVAAAAMATVVLSGRRPRRRA